jgi:SAM-dependent methyltransferase
MTPSTNPYDELPYQSYPIEWTAPERLALASLLHGGPRPPLDDYRVLELGCGSGANLLALAYYRRHGTFVGVDGARGPIDIARESQSALGLTNVEFVHADFGSAPEHLAGRFDYVLVHGVFSWVPHPVRDALLDLVTRYLRPGGLLYLNYNTRPGWNVRGLVREFLRAQTAGGDGLRARAQRAQEVAGKVVAALDGVEHPYSRLLANEFRFVGEGDLSWVGHEFLSPDNHPYWRSEFLALARGYGLEFVADADFNYATSRVPPDLAPKLGLEAITGRSIEDTVDLLCYRQLHSPILTPAPFDRRPPDPGEFGALRVASALEPVPPTAAGQYPVFRHANGYEVDAKDEVMTRALTKLYSLWPTGLAVAEAFPDVSAVEEDLRLLHRNGLIELRCREPAAVDPTALHKLERERGYFTTAAHQTGRVDPA